MHEPRQAPELLMSRVATSGVPIFGRLWEAGCLFSTEEKQRSAVDRQMYSLCEMLTDDSSQHALDHSILDQLQARLGTTTRTRLLPLSPFDHAVGSVGADDSRLWVHDVSVATSTWQAAEEAAAVQRSIEDCFQEEEDWEQDQEEAAAYRQLHTAEALKLASGKDELHTQIKLHVRDSTGQPVNLLQLFMDNSNLNSQMLIDWLESVGLGGHIAAKKVANGF